MIGTYLLLTFNLLIDAAILWALRDAPYDETWRGTDDRTADRNTG